MDCKGLHATLCGKGPDALVAHSALERWLAQTLRNAGWAAVLEQPIVDWNHVSKKSGKMIHAIMDIVGSRPDKPTIYADVTVRNPMAGRYGESGTIEQAEREKATAYPPTHGMQVTPLAFETWGRCSSGTVQFLRQMAADTAARHRDKGWRSTESLAVLLAYPIGAEKPIRKYHPCRNSYFLERCLPAAYRTRCILHTTDLGNYTCDLPIEKNEYADNHALALARGSGAPHWPQVSRWKTQSGASQRGFALAYRYRLQAAGVA